MTDKLQSKRAALLELLQTTETEYQKVDARRNELIANHTALRGAVQVIDDLVKESEQSNASPTS